MGTGICNETELVSPLIIIVNSISNNRAGMVANPGMAMIAKW